MPSPTRSARSADRGPGARRRRARVGSAPCRMLSGQNAKCSAATASACGESGGRGGDGHQQMIETERHDPYAEAVLPGAEHRADAGRVALVVRRARPADRRRDVRAAAGRDQGEARVLERAAGIEQRVRDAGGERVRVLAPGRPGRPVRAMRRLPRRAPPSTPTAPLRRRDPRGTTPLRASTPSCRARHARRRRRARPAAARPAASAPAPPSHPARPARPPTTATARARGPRRWCRPVSRRGVEVPARGRGGLPPASAAGSEVSPCG